MSFFKNKKYKNRGNWTLIEDMEILNFAKENGSKWSVLSKIMVVRTEHSVKNRFFTLISSYLSLPVKKIKKQVDYLNKNLIEETITYHTPSTYELPDQKIQNVTISEENESEDFTEIWDTNDFNFNETNDFMFGLEGNLFSL